jgi:hypothetical protein
MASFEDYDEFGNYIGADLDSDEEDQGPQNDFGPNVQDQAPLAGYDDDQMHAKEENSMMDIDGSPLSFIVVSLGLNSAFHQNPFTKQWFYTRTSNITPLQKTSMGQTWRRLFKKRTPNL